MFPVHQRHLGVALAVICVACKGREAVADAHSAPPSDEVRFAPGSPKLAMLSLDVVREARTRIVARLPALVVANEDHTVRVTTPVAGRILALLAAPGEHVTAGQPLARIRSGDIGQVSSDLVKASTTAKTASASLARATDLYDHKLISAREVEQARNDAEQARAEFDRATRRAAQLGVPAGGVNDDYLLRAPVGGVVIDRAANPGLEVRPDNPAPLFTVSSLGSLWLTVNVAQHDLSFVHRGARLRFITDAVPGRVFDARVNFVSDALDPVSRTATARAVIDNSDGALKLQSSGQAEVIVDDTATSLTVPTRAVVTNGDQAIVFVAVAPGRFVRRVVTVRDDDGVTSTISAGLAAGDRVVTTGSLLLAGELSRGH